MARIFNAKITMTVFLAVVFMFSNAQNGYWDKVSRDYESRDGVSDEVKYGIKALEGATDSSARKTARYLKFLYAYMPQSDLADYDFDFFKRQVDVACEARAAFSWGRNVPEDMFRHFVLVYRVNNENLDTARSFIFNKLKDRVKNMSMYDAALEVNHWCHEHVDYQPADARTSAPLATLRTSHGRCGEESTLTVTAMRAVGIPARQCYTPRWAHCDDNHAWVEVWIDGKWRFLGACEPAPALDMGWFANVSTRTMMVHTNVFGRYEGPEEVNRQTQYYSCINLLSNYADTVTAYVTVYDKLHRPATDASVCFKLYNYAEYYTLAEVKTDEQGRAKLNTGLGDLLVWAKKDGDYAYAKLDLRRQNHLVLILDDKDNDAFKAFSMKPPAGRPVAGSVDAAAQTACDKRMAREDKMREAYRKSFPTKAQTDKYTNEYFTSDEFYDVIRRSEGNHAEILKFLQNHSKKEPGIFLKEFIDALSDKDLRDTRAETLESQLVKYRENEKCPVDVFVKGVLPARVSNELIRDWRRPLNAVLYEIIQGGATGFGKPTLAQLADWTKRYVTVDPLCNYYNCPVSPMGVVKTRRADAHSRNIFFVAACRSLSIPCYLDNASGKIYVWENESWREFAFETETAVPSGDLAVLTMHNPKNLTYYVNYTLQRLVDGEYVSYDFEGDPRVEKTHIVLNLPPGRYCLSTGNRYSDGEVLSELRFFDLKAKERKDLTIDLPKLVRKDGVYGKIDLRENVLGGKTLEQHLEESGKECLVLCVVRPGTEPANHLVKEMASLKEKYEKWGGKVLIASTSRNWKSERNQPGNVEIFTDNIGKFVESAASSLKNAVHDGSMERTTGEYPLCMVVDKAGNMKFVSEGYRIGLGGLLLESVEMRAEN